AVVACSTIAPSRRDRPASNRVDPPRVFTENCRLDFRPFRMLVDSTRRNSLIRWQKRAAAREHGFESRWGHLKIARAWTGRSAARPTATGVDPFIPSGATRRQRQVEKWYGLPHAGAAADG